MAINPNLHILKCNETLRPEFYNGQIWNINPKKINIVCPSNLKTEINKIPDVTYVDENTILPGLSYCSVQDIIYSITGEKQRAGWYLQQFLKMAWSYRCKDNACPTLWGLTKEHCKDIPIKKAKNCIMTLTDYNINYKRDSKIIETLIKNYNKVYYWPQGNGDFTYFKELPHSDEIAIIPPSLTQYNNFLSATDVDYIGTRLHGGIRALQYKHRTIIIGIDNRALEMHRDFNIPVLSEHNMDSLDKTVNSEISTEINLPEENIKKFLNQFTLDD